MIPLPYRVILDTNFLFLPLTRRLDVFSEIERLLSGRVQFIVLKPVRKELERLSSKSYELGRKASFALRFLEKCEEVPVELDGMETVDEAIVRIAKENRDIVATSDMALRKKLRDINVPVIYVRNCSKLELEGFPKKNVAKTS